MNFRGTFNRTRQIGKLINLPMIEDNIKTQGIGFEDAPECLFINCSYCYEWKLK